MAKKIVIANKKIKDSNQENTGNNTMEDHKTFNSKAMKSENFEEMFEQSMADFNQGEIIHGRVVIIQGDDVFVDVGYKSDGKISLTEFDDPVQIGDEISVMMINTEDEQGNIVLSKRKADSIYGQKLIEDAYKNNKPIQAKVIKEIKGGFTVSLYGIEGFVPGSQIDIKKDSQANYIGNKFQFKIMKYATGKGNIILSRKVFLEEELYQKQDEYFKQIKEGTKVNGVIKTVLDYGAFIELDDFIHGFVHITDLTWNHIKSCKEVLSLGDSIEALVLKVDHENKKINLGIKQLQTDPWKQFYTNHQPNDMLEGEVIRLTDFGAFIKVDEGIEGLIHVKELSWTKRISHPKEILKVGNKIQAVILNMDDENRKLSLSLRQVLPNPWDDIEDRYPKGRKVKGKIKNITNFGVFIELENELVGMLHANDIDWTKKSNNLKKENQFEIGNEIDVVILETNNKDKTISLGLKQLLDNPWEIYRANHPKGSIVSGKITKVTESGVIIQLEKELEGFLHASEMNKKREDKVEDTYKVDDDIKCLIKSYDIKKSKITLSIRDYEKRLEQETINKYIVTKDESDNDSVTLGDIIKINNIQE